jgi:DNA-binding transcriptional ArsR family regulator
MRARNDVVGAKDVRVPSFGDDDQMSVRVSVLAAQMLGHMSDPTRFQLLRLLVVGEQDVGTLTSQVPASRSSVSQHLGRLRLAGLVSARRDGRRVLYALTSDHIQALVAEAVGFAEHLLDGIPHHRDDQPRQPQRG